MEEVEKNDLKAVLLLFGNLALKDQNTGNIDPKIQRAREYPDIFPVVYDSFKLNIPYSLDSRYLAHSGNFGSRTIQIIESRFHIRCLFRFT